MRRTERVFEFRGNEANLAGFGSRIAVRTLSATFSSCFRSRAEYGASHLADLRFDLWPMQSRAQGSIGSDGGPY